MSQLQPNLFECQTLTVTELTVQIRDVLGEVFPDVTVIGEVSNLKYHGSGHVYFTLKDANAQLKCVLWASQVKRIKFQLEHGQELILRGKIDLYPLHGTYQLVVENVTPKGMGALELAFRQLYERLNARGWFSPERKKELPRFPSRIGLVTSPSGAALRDMLRILKERWPLAEIWIIPVPVQGEGAAPRIADALNRINDWKYRPDVLIVGRGGGSLEDLWAFNEEILAAAIVASRIPIISAIGHETDTTIADLVADCRAPTPSKAADMIVPSIEEQCHRLETNLHKIRQLIVSRLIWDMSRLQRIAEQRFFTKPLQRLKDAQQGVDELAAQLEKAMVNSLKQSERKLAERASLLEALSPLHVLSRGYTLTRSKKTREPIVCSSQVSAGDVIETLLHQGSILSRVEQTTQEVHSS